MAAARIRSAAEIGDVMRVTAIAGELKSENELLAPLCDKVVELSENFDLDGILKLADELKG